MADIGSLVGTLELNTAKFDSAVTGLNQKLDAIATHLSGVGQSADRAATQMATLPTAATKAAGATDEAANAAKRASSAGDAWTGSLGNLGNALQQVGGPGGQIAGMASQASSLLALMSGPGGLVVGFAAVAAGAVALAHSLADDIERLDNLSDVTGLSVAALQTFEQVAREAGEAPEALARGLGRVNSAIADILQGRGAAAEAFEDIGVNLRRMVQDGASTEQILQAVAVAIAKIEDPTRKAAVMVDLFGSRSKALQIVLQQLAKDGLDPMIERMRQSGNVTSEETNRMAREFDKMVDSASRSARGFLTEVKAASATAAIGIRDVAAAFIEITQLRKPGPDWNTLRPPEVGAKRGDRDDIAAQETLGRVVKASNEQIALQTTLDQQLAQAQAQVKLAVAQASGSQLDALKQITEGKRAALQADFIEQVQAIKKTTGATEQGLAEQLQAIEIYKQRVLALEAETGAARNAIIKQNTAAAADIFRGLGSGFEEVTKKLDLKSAGINFSEQVGKLRETFKQGDIDARTFADGVSAIQDEYRKMGASAEQVGAIVDGASKKIITSSRENYDQVVEIDGVYTNLTGTTKKYEKSVEEVVKDSAQVTDEFQKQATQQELIATAYQNTATAQRQVIEGANLIPPALDQVLQKNRALEESFGATRTEIERTTASVVQLADAYERARDAADRLERKQTKESLDDSMKTIGSVAGSVADDMDNYAKHLQSIYDWAQKIGTVSAGFGAIGPKGGNYNDTSTRSWATAEQPGYRGGAAPSPMTVTGDLTGLYGTGPGGQVTVGDILGGRVSTRGPAAAEPSTLARATGQGAIYQNPTLNVTVMMSRTVSETDGRMLARTIVSTARQEMQRGTL